MDNKTDLPEPFKWHLDNCNVCPTVVATFPNLALFDHHLCETGKPLFRDGLDSAAQNPSGVSTEPGKTESGQPPQRIWLNKIRVHPWSCAVWSETYSTASEENVPYVPAAAYDKLALAADKALEWFAAFPHDQGSNASQFELATATENYEQLRRALGKDKE